MYSKMEKRAAAQIHKEYGSAWRVELQEIEFEKEYLLVYYVFSYQQCEWVEFTTTHFEGQNARQIVYMVADELMSRFELILEYEFPQDGKLLRKRATTKEAGTQPFKIQVDLSHVLYMVRQLDAHDLQPHVVGGVKIALRDAAARITEAFTYVASRCMLQWTIKKFEQGFTNKIQTWLKHKVDKRVRKMQERRANYWSWQKRQNDLGRKRLARIAEHQRKQNGWCFAQFCRRQHKRTMKSFRRLARWGERFYNPPVYMKWTKEAEEVVRERYRVLLESMRRARSPQRRVDLDDVWERALKKPAGCRWRRVVSLQGKRRIYALARQVKKWSPILNFFLWSILCRKNFNVDRALTDGRAQFSVEAVVALAERAGWFSDSQVLPPLIEHQAGEEDPLNMDPVAETSQARSSNVVVIDQGTVSTVSSQSVVPFNSFVGEGREMQITSQLANRFALFDTFSWEAVKNQGDILKTYDIPYALCGKPFSDSPNFLMLRKWAYWHFDIEMRIQLNSNRFQVGQLLVAWDYDFTSDRKRMARFNEAIQAPHAIVAAPSNNVVELCIPFKHKFPYWAVSDNLAQSRATARVSVYVLSPLKVSEGVSNKCNVSVLVRLLNVRVAGMRKLTLSFIEHQMFSMLVNQAESLLRNVLPDRNRDNPTNPTAHIAVVPYSAHSWCVGTNQVEHLNPLRLDPTAVTPHVEPTDEMSVLYVARHFGFVKALEWQTTHSTGKLVGYFTVTPVNVCDLSIRDQADPATAKLSVYESTPLSMVTGLFSYWRGSIEFRFDFVASAFHTGRLAVCFVPGNAEIQRYEDCIQSYVQYFDLQTDTSFTFVCPYISNKTWCSVTKPTPQFPSTLDSVECIGGLFLYVINPLVTIDSVSNTVRINSYIRAGLDFKVAVPSFPLLYPAMLGQTYIPMNDNIYAKSGYYPVYAGNWRNWFGGKKVILRYGAVSDHIAQFTPVVNEYAVYYASFPIIVPTARGDVVCSYFVRAHVGDTYMYLTPFETFEHAQLFVKSKSQGYLMQFIRDGPYAWVNGQVLTPVSQPVSTEVQVEAQAGDERLEPHEECGFGMSDAVTSMHYFNEDFQDLKSLCRRYQLYFDVSIRISDTLAFGESFLMVPLNPAGIHYDFDKYAVGNLYAEFVNRARAGPMAILANGFRFFRGGLRVKIIFKSQTSDNMVLGVTHIPNRYYAEIPAPYKAVNTLGFSPHGYAYYCQSSRVNECMELEVPYYLNTDFGLLNCSGCTVTDEDRLHSTLGSLAFSSMSRLPSKPFDLGIQIFVAFADDMRFSSFQGFSGMCSTMQIPDRNIRLASPISPQLSQSEREPEPFVLVEPQFGFTGFKEQISEGLTEGCANAASIMEATASRIVSNTGENVMSKVTLILDKLKETLGVAFSGIRQLMGTIVSNLVHVLTHPHWVTLLTAVLSILYAVFPFLSSGASALYSIFNSVMEYWHEGSSEIQMEPVIEVGIEAQSGKFLDIEGLGFQYIVVLASCLGFKLTGARKTFPNFLGYLVVNLPRLKLGVQGIVDFIRVNVQMIYASVDWLSRKMGGVGIDHYIYSYPEELKEFCSTAHLLLNPLNLQRIRTEPVLQRTVFRMATRAQQILVSESANSSSSRLSLHIRDLCSKLSTLQESLVNDCLSPMVRYEPFVLQMNGPPGIGKSELCQSLCIKLLSAIDYKSYSEPMFTRTSGTQYWNGVNTQPCVYYDDFLFADSGELATACISEFMQLKSCATFNPSIAELENKKFRYSPLIVMLATNQAFWDVTFIKNRNALHRRRDRLMEVRLKEGWTMDRVKEEFSTTGVKKYDHLEFALYPDVLDEHRQPDQWMSFEQFEVFITSFFREYHARHLKLYKARLAELDASLPHTPGLVYDEKVEQEVIKWLALKECSTNALVTDEWRSVVREQCSTASTTLTGRDPGIAALLETLAQVSPAEPQFDVDGLVDDEEVEFSDTSDREDAPQAVRCIHFRQLTLDFAYVYLEDEQQSVYHKIDDTPFGEDIPADCNSLCWLQDPSSTQFRTAYVGKYFRQWAFTPMTEEERDRNIPNWARHHFAPSLTGAITAATQNETRRSRYLARLRALPWSEYLETGKKVLKWFSILSGIFLSVFGAFKLASGFLSNSAASDSSTTTTTTVDPWHVMHDYAPSGDVRVARKGLPKNWQKQARIRANVLKMKFARPEYNDLDPLTSFQNLLKRSCFEALLEVDGTERYGQKGYGLCGRVAVITKHFIEKFKFLKDQGSVVFFVYRQKNIRLKFTFEELKFVVTEESSIALVEFSKTMNNFRDSRNHIISVNDLAYLTCEGRVFEVTQNEYYVNPVVFSTEEHVEICGAEGISAQSLPMCYSYDFAGRGKCGSILYVVKPVPRIIGFHVAGQTGKNFGYAQAVFREMFEGIEAMGVAEPKMEHQGTEIEPKITLPPNTQFVGCLPPEACPSQPRHTQIVPTLMHDDVFPHVTEPAVLSIHDRRVVEDPDIDPLVKAIQTHGNVPLPFKSDTLQDCVQDLSDYLIATTRPILAFSEELLDDQVVFGGLPLGEGFKKINLQSSEGYPLSLFRQYNTEEYALFGPDKVSKNQSKTGKNWLFRYSTRDSGVVLEEIHPELISVMQHNDALRKKGQIPATIFVDTLKDSRVLPEKVKKGKTRMFSISPVEFTWVIRKYFGVFQAAYQHSRIDNGTAIGINVNSLEWTKLARTLLSKGNNFVVGDYKAFGDTLQRDVMFGAFQAIINWYAHYFNTPPEVTQYRSVLVEELFSVNHLATNVLYKMFCGLPSGFALTVEINDLVNQLYMRYCWKEITHLPLCKYHQLVKTVTYGDDIIMSVNASVVEKFNFNSIRRCLESYEIAFQPAAKDGSEYETLPLTDVTFLKAHFVVHPYRRNCFLARLPIESALDTLNWQMKGNDRVSILYENSRAALNNLYGLGPEEYQKWRAKLISWFGSAAQRGIIPKRDGYVHLKTWREIDDEIFD
uniref:Genome polyprotein n=1 Tax=Ixodes holocyclus iflavirus TaxID=1969401 RepID=A0A2I2MRF4_9VIRU|nr:polyprotein [Ixodes holocyclus iflavirus]